MLGGDGRELTVHDTRGPLAVVDRATFRVHTPGGEPRQAATAPARDDGDGGPPWTLIATAAAALLLAAGAKLALRRRNRADALAPLDDTGAEPELLHSHAHR